MGWVEKVKNIICGLKASGKSEKEIEQIVQQAADKATIKAARESDELARISVELSKATGTFARDATDALIYAMQVIRVDSIRQQRQQANNWRKMHGLPMRRKGKRRR